jgi:cytochrome c-type biogenesis protein CcmH/NrfG
MRVNVLLSIERFNDETAVSIVIGVGVTLPGVALIVAIALGVYVACLVYRRKTRAGKHEPLLAAERGRKRDERERKRKA